MYIYTPRRLFSSTFRLLQQTRIPAAYYRGGTSRALLFNESDLPPGRDAWNRIFLGAMGSPDPHGRQLDGMGGGISSLSKVCVVGAASPSRRTDAQVEFTFAQVGIRSADVDYAGNCGNMSSAVGPFAVEAGLVPQTPGPGTTTVKLYNTNTHKRIDATFPVAATGTPRLSGSEFAIDGVAGTAGRIRLDFVDPAGSKTGSLLPTGRRVEEIQGVRASCVDAGNPCVFVHASEPALGLDKLPVGKGKKGHLADIRPEDLQARPGILDRLESVRQHATVKMGMASSLDEVPASIPKICMVDRAPPSGDGDGGAVDVTVRAISTQQPHKALPITAGLALSAAARLEGTVVHECLQLQGRGDGDGEGIRIGHPSGKLDVGARYVDGTLQSTTVYRTARRLMEGSVYVD